MGRGREGTRRGKGVDGTGGKGRGQPPPQIFWPRAVRALLGKRIWTCPNNVEYVDHGILAADILNVSR